MTKIVRVARNYLDTYKQEKAMEGYSVQVLSDHGDTVYVGLQKNVEKNRQVVCVLKSNIQNYIDQKLKEGYEVEILVEKNDMYVVGLIPILDIADTQSRSR